MRQRIRGLVLAVALLGAATAQGATEAADSADAGEPPLLLLADELTYDRELGIATARGNVEISRGDRVVHADTISYNEVTDVVTATGNVSLTDENGNTVFAEYVELTDDLKEGAIQGIRMLLEDRSRLAANGAKRTAGNRTEMDHAVYSPCELCEDDPSRAPLWQLKAVKVVHDQDKHRIEYRDAWLEIFGVPVFYTPYFSHPDPAAKRQSGLLAPRFGYSDKTGFWNQTPYYWVIAPDKDLTIAPILSTGELPVFFAEYRQRIEDGRFSFAGSANITDEDDGQAGLREGEFRGHIETDGRFDIDDNWRWGFDIERSTDKTYERLFDFSDERTLTSHVFGEMFEGRNYAALQGYAFQGTRDIDRDEEAPIVLPLIDYNFISEPVWVDSFFSFDANMMVLSRIEGRDSRRLSLRGGWVLPYTSPLGDIYRLSATIQGDLYQFNDVDPNSDNPNPAGLTEDGVDGRLFPQLSLEWRYPFAREHEGWREIIEPMAQIVVGPNTGNPGRIPNEDSLDIEFDDTNLFDANRFAGLDRVDTGQRVNYGLRWGYYGDSGGSASVFLGQSYAFNDLENFEEGSGLNRRLSDLVGAVQISPADYMDLLYRFRYDSDSLNAQRNEVLLQAGTPRLNLDLSYAFVSDEADPDTAFGDREEIAARLGGMLDDNWSAFVAGRRDLEGGRMLSYGGGLGYQDECFEIRASVFRNRFQDEERDPEIEVLFSIAFKNLGSFGTAP